MSILTWFVLWRLSLLRHDNFCPSSSMTCQHLRACTYEPLRWCAGCTFGKSALLPRMRTAQYCDAYGV